jgi:hypothetical protein
VSLSVRTVASGGGTWKAVVTGSVGAARIDTGSAGHDSPAAAERAALDIVGDINADDERNLCHGTRCVRYTRPGNCAC